MTDYSVHISFYNEADEKMLSSVDHACPPRIGEKVWLEWTDDNNAYRSSCCEVVDLQWSYPSPRSDAARRGLMGGMVDVIVRSATGVFR